MQRLPFSCSIELFCAAKTAILDQERLRSGSKRVLQVIRWRATGTNLLTRARARTMIAGSLALLFLREEVEQPNNAQIGDDPQQKCDDHRHKGNVGLW